MPLIEIVSEPEISSPDEAYEYLTRLKEIILYTGVSDCNMEEGSLRCDANVSIRPRGQESLAPRPRSRTSTRSASSARRWSTRSSARSRCSSRAARSCRRRASTTPAKASTYSMRSKEQAHDYRYFPEPDLLPLVVDGSGGAEIVGANCPSCPRPAAHAW